MTISTTSHHTPRALWREWNITRVRQPEGQRRWYGAPASRYRLTDAYRLEGQIWTPRVSVYECPQVPVRCAHNAMDDRCECGWYGFNTLEDLCATTGALYGEAFGVFQVTSVARAPWRHGWRVMSGWPSVVVINLDRVQCLGRRDERILARAAEHLRTDYGARVYAATVGEFWEHYHKLVHQPAPLYQSQCSR